jgi:hypothetical protein
MEVFMNKNVLFLICASLSVLLLTDCSASCLEELDPAERTSSNKVAFQNNAAASSTSEQVPTENEEPTVNPVVAFFENMPKEEHVKFLNELGFAPRYIRTDSTYYNDWLASFKSTDRINYYDWSGLESEDPAKVEEATARWERAQQAIQNGNEHAAREVVTSLWNSKKLEECMALIESFCARTTHDSVQKFGMYAKIEGYTKGDYGFEHKKDPSKARAILEQGKSENDDYLTQLYWTGVMEGTYGFPKPENLEGVFSLASAGNKKLRQLIIEGYWLGDHSLPKDSAEGRRINDLYIEEEIKEPFDYKLSHLSAILRKLRGLHSRPGDLYCYKEDAHAFEQFLEKLKAEGSVEVKAFARFVHTALKDDIEIKKQEESRRQETLRREEEFKRQQELRRQEAEKRSKETKVARSGFSVGTVSSFATPPTNTGKFNFSGK